jgi:hypothetical protein
MILLDPDSDIGVIARRDRNAERILPEILRVMGAQYAGGDRNIEMNVNLAYEYADAMEARRTQR